MEQVKIFSGHREKVESDLNDWLKTNKVHIADRFVSQGDDWSKLLVLIFFKRLTEVDQNHPISISNRFDDGRA